MNSKILKAVLSLVLVMALVLGVVSCGKGDTESKATDSSATSEAPAEAAKVTAGTYSASEKGYSSDVKVDVTVDESGSITDIKVDASGETPTIGGEAAPVMAENIKSGQRLDVDTVSGATFTSKAILAATENALTQAGVDVSTLKPEEVAAAEDEEVTVDVGIIGGGASGTAAAAAAIDGGASVIMVERTGNVGGISKYFAGGPFAVESHLQEEAGEEYSYIKNEDVLQTINNYAHFINYAPLTKAIIEKSGDTIRWMEEWGVTFHVNPETPQIAHRDDDLKWKLYHWFDTFSYTDKTESAIDIVHERLNEKGLDLRINTTGTSLIQDSNGNVVGFEAIKEDGSKLTVNAKAVVVATGGFAGSKEMMEEYYYTPYLGNWGEEGSGVKMAWDAGAAKWDLQSSLLHGNGIAPAVNQSEINLGNTALDQITRSPLMWIDQSGNRYCNEEAVWDTAYASNTAYSVGGIYFILVDTATLNSYTNGTTLVMDTAVGGPNMEEADFVELCEEGVRQGNIFKGDTVEALAQELGMKAERLVGNVEEYNQAIESKNDPYGKSAESLVFPVSDGPYYAIKMQISNLGTLGGVRVNEKLQATDVNLTPVKGLYMAGNDAAGFYGNITSYPPYEGLATGFACNSGRIAGENASLEAK